MEPGRTKLQTKLDLRLRQALKKVRKSSSEDSFFPWAIFYLLYSSPLKLRICKNTNKQKSFSIWKECLLIGR